MRPLTASGLWPVQLVRRACCTGMEYFPLLESTFQIAPSWESAARTMVGVPSTDAMPFRDLASGILVICLTAAVVAAADTDEPVKSRDQRLNEPGIPSKPV